MLKTIVICRYLDWDLFHQVLQVGIKNLNRLPIKLNLPQSCSLRSNQRQNDSERSAKRMVVSQLCGQRTLSRIILVSILVSIPNSAGTLKKRKGTFYNVAAESSSPRLQQTQDHVPPNLLLLQPLSQRLDGVPVAVLVTVVLNKKTWYLKHRSTNVTNTKQMPFKKRTKIVTRIITNERIVKMSKQLISNCTDQQKYIQGQSRN